MARLRRPRWVHSCFVLLCFLQLFAAVMAAPALHSLSAGDDRTAFHQEQLFSTEPYVIQSNQRRSNPDNFRPFVNALYRRRDVVQNEDDDSDDTTTTNVDDDDNIMEQSLSSSRSSSNSRALLLQANIASTVCNSDAPQSLGPAWNGSFSSNSADGVYPSQARSCTWILQAITNGTNPDGTTNNSTHPIPYVIAINFTSSIQLVCGTDYLTLYDGPDTTSPVLAKICGNIPAGQTPTIYSTGPQLTAVFSTQTRSPGSFGFIAAWSSVAPCAICVSSGQGTCSNTNTCICNSRFSGVVCDADTVGFKDFTPRSQHAMAYDPIKDMVYIMGGTSLANPFMWDLLTYTFATNKWSKINLNSTRSPDPRYGHYAFIYNTDLYIYGGISAYGALAELWKYNGKAWTQQQPINPEKLPVGRIGSACVVVSNNNSTKLYVFGGLNAGGVTTRDLNIYDINLAMWKKSDHQNSVGLSGATAVYHQATDSIYYFGGLVNQTTRNVITYQYRISQDLWYALAPRIDPLTATPVSYPDGSQPDSSSAFNTTNGDSGDDSTSPDAQNDTVQYFPPVMYDSVTTVWAPAGLMGDDSVVMYGGMRPFGLGVNEKDQTCYSKSFSLYDLSCQKWTTFDASELDPTMGGRVNHTMILRPPGAAGASKTAWTAYIFGGFDGVDHGDMLNVTMNIVAPPAATTNKCRALRWCSLYDDCQNCNPSYCSYVNGLCLFDTDKTKNTGFLAGSFADIPTTGTVQDLIRQRPDLESQVLPSTDSCPTRNALDLGNPFSGQIQSDQEMTFKIYVDAQDLDIQFEIRTVPNSALNFKSLNVWEGFMNMYWRADHGLTDDSWNGFSETSSPLPPDVSITADNVTAGDGPVIIGAGMLNTSELMSRWTNYAGLDASLSMSAVKENASYIYFPASDPRRFSGYYVFSLTNRNSAALSFTVAVTLLDHPTSVDKPSGSQFNMATLGFFMLGFIFALVLLIFMARKIRQLIEDRDASHRAAEMQLLEDDDDDQSRNGRIHGGMAMVQMDGSTLNKKPMYRIVVGVQDLDKYISALSGAATLRHRKVRGDGRVGGGGYLGADGGSGSKRQKTIARSQSESVVPQQQTGVIRDEQPIPEGKKRSRVRSDYIRDIGSASLPSATEGELTETTDMSKMRSSLSSADPRLMAMSTPNLGRDLNDGYLEENLHNEVAQISLTLPIPGDRNSPKEQDRGKGDGMNLAQGESTSSPNTSSVGLQHRWSLTALSRATSFRLSQKLTNNDSSEEREGLTTQELKEEDEGASHSGSGCYDSEQEMVDLRVLSAHTDLLHMQHKEAERQQRAMKEQAEMAAAMHTRRNPVKVQPLSVEPLAFHAGLVPRTLSNLRRYQKYLARQQHQQQQQQQRQRRQRSDNSLVDERPTSPETGAGIMSDHQSQSRLAGCNTVRSAAANADRPSSRFRNHPTTSLAASQRLQLPRQIRASRSQGSLREVHKAASRITLRTNGEALVARKDLKKLKRSKSAILTRRPSQEQQQHDIFAKNGSEVDLEAGMEMRQIATSGVHSSQLYTHQALEQRHARSPTFDESPSTPPRRKSIKMRGRQEYEPGPLLAMNYLIVFPGDAGSRRVRQQGDLWRESQWMSPEGEDNVHDNERERQQQEQQYQQQQQDDTLYSTEKRLPPMAVGTVFVPDPVRWWAYKAKQVQDRQKFEKQMRRMAQTKERTLQVPQAAKTR